jgi:hypothetical protein
MHLVDKIVNNTKAIFHQTGIRIVRYADDFVLLGEKITDEAMERLRSILTRMGLKLNEQKTRQVQAKDTAFNFLGFTIRYDKDIHGRNNRYWNIIPSAKSENKIREKVREFLGRYGHYNPRQVAEGLNTILRGWLNYFDIPKTSYPAMSKRDIRYYLVESLNRYYNRKSQRRSRLYGAQAFDLLVYKYGLIEPTKYKVKG